MSDDELKSAIGLMREARESARGYADFFEFNPSRDQEELGVVMALAKALDSAGELYFHQVLLRGRGDDPPDCEAVNMAGEKVAIEVTELVDGEAIRAVKSHPSAYVWADWSKDKFEKSLNHLVSRKDSRFPFLKGAPYNGGYTVLIFSDEPLLNKKTVSGYLQSTSIPQPKNIDKVFLLLSYDAAIKNYPYFDISFS